MRLRIFSVLGLPGQPVEFLPRVRVEVDSDGRIAVTIKCLSDAEPVAVVTWLRGGQAVTSSNQHQISAGTTQLTVRHFNISEFLTDEYTCTSSNPLGHKTRTTRLLGTVVIGMEGVWEIVILIGVNSLLATTAFKRCINKHCFFHYFEKCINRVFCLLLFLLAHVSQMAMFTLT